jgi:hypothetical protein
MLSLLARYVRALIGVGTNDKLRPSLRTGQANFSHQMWSTTFGALCGLPTYVALSS